ncbi:MAG TPA: TonB family protein [Terriglobales bacterium]|nr:TonB family protein [Terriglobales bacterium]
MALLLHLLLFSSDDKAAQTMTQLFAATGIQVERCSDILKAIERLTAGNFHALVADWDEGQEASFLVKAARDLKSTQNCVALALVRDAAGAACAVQVGAHGTLSKPVVQSEILEAVITLRELLRSKDTPKAPRVPPARITSPASNKRVVTDSSRIATAPKREPKQEVPSLSGQVAASELPAKKQPEAAPVPSQVYTGPLFSSLPYMESSPARPLRKGRILGVLSFLLLISATLYVWAPESVYGVKLASMVLSVLDRSASHQTEEYLLSFSAPVAPGSTFLRHISHSIARPVSPQSAQILADAVSDIREMNTADVDRSAAYQEFTPTSGQAPFYAAVPESLRAPVTGPSGPVGGTAPPGSPRLLRPVLLAEEVARKLLVATRPPMYPEGALREGLQGPVVLEALISKDGNISDLKVVRGHFALARAAVQAVQQWRFKPYVLNGQATEAATFLTINFKLPPLQAEKQPPRPVNAAQARF